MNKKQTSQCSQAVKDYLQTAQKSETQEIMVVAGNNITVDYIGRLNDGSVFDTSIESIATACGKYQTGRDYGQGLSFQVGGGQMIPGFDAGVQGMRLGETKTITIPYQQAYGERDEKKLLKMQITEEFKDLKKGDSLMTDYGPIKVYETTKDSITFDTNHELAGKDLIFDITIKEIN